MASRVARPALPEAGVALVVDDALVPIAQSLGYPLQRTADIFEFTGDEPRDPAAYTRTAGSRCVHDAA